jgi:hypothetical protein
LVGLLQPRTTPLVACYRPRGMPQPMGLLQPKVTPRAAWRQEQAKGLLIFLLAYFKRVFAPPSWTLGIWDLVILNQTTAGA